MIKKMKLVSCFLACSLFFSSITVAASSNPNALPEKDVHKVTPLLTEISVIPDSLLVNRKSNEISNYLKSKGIIMNIYNEEQGEQARNKRGAAGCTLAIGTVLVTAAIPIAKIKKIKQYIETLGGIELTVLHLIKDTSVATKTEEATVALSGLLAELSGIKEISSECV
ncbi:hypothetical protein [Paenibacillus popilliae]|uniref:Pre-mRNA cleavagep/olyadenylation specificity factor n=1 Tax=Paenibacillus popilliae ATCC 14706 TaxID=1212764 RepID=M9L9M0_PAEPP|nr:hypothetical protein [Paenibacillus popilliae]GAC42147.1 pre-mRNA cleavagep/olyadenylation specificity factor [Paenibacillus popilliae ATCC 14706]